MIDRLPFKVQVVYHLECSACGDVSTQMRYCGQGDPVAAPNVPDHWVVFADELYCPKHRVKMMLDVDGVETVLRSRLIPFLPEK